MLHLNPVDRFARWLGQTLAWLFAVAMVLIAYEVVMRYAFNSPTIWVHDLTITLVGICFVFGGAFALQRDEHIRITTIVQHVSPRTRRWLTFGCDVTTLAFLAPVTFAAIHQAIPSIEIMETSGRAWDVPIPVVLKSVLALGSLLMTVQALWHAWETLRGRRPAP